MQTMTSPLAATWQAGVDRREARREPYKSHTGAEKRQAWLEGRTLASGDVFAPEFRAPQTAAEYFDDRIIERNRSLWELPETALLLEVADAARGGAEAAVKAVKAARRLDVRTQRVVHANLTRWKRGDEAAQAGAERTINAVLGEWSRLRLAQTESEEDE
jgi:hypothetical protein